MGKSGFYEWSSSLMCSNEICSYDQFKSLIFIMIIKGCGLSETQLIEITVDTTALNDSLSIVIGLAVSYNEYFLLQFWYKL